MKHTLETAKVLMRFSSSRMLPWLADSICRMVSSSRLSSAFMRALFTIRLDFISDRSGRSYIGSASIEHNEKVSLSRHMQLDLKQCALILCMQSIALQSLVKVSTAGLLRHSLLCRKLEKHQLNMPNSMCRASRWLMSTTLMSQS